MIVDCAVYNDGSREAQPSDIATALQRCHSDEDAFVWLGMYEPTREELDGVAAQFDLHPLAVEDAVNAHQRPKLEHYGSSLFLVLKTVRYRQDAAPGEHRIEIGELMIFVGDSFVVTVRHGSGASLSDVRARLEAEKHTLAHGPLGAVYAICDRVVDDYMVVAEELAGDLDDLEQQVFAPEGAPHSRDAAAIYTMQREVVRFRRSVTPLLTPMQRLAGGAVPAVPERARPFFRDVADHIARVGDTIESFDAMLTNVLQAQLAMVSVRQNDDMRKISAYVAMAAVPTLIAGIYGMNFDHMPELHWYWAYPGVIGIMLAIVVGLYVAFRRSGWL